MTSITRLDDQQCQALSGGCMPPIYKPKRCYPSRPSGHVSIKHVSKAYTFLAQGNAAANTSIGLGGFSGTAIADASQANSAAINTMAG